MLCKQNPTAKGRALWNSCGGWFRDPLTFSAYRAQYLIAAYGLRPELAAMLAAFAFGGGDHG